MDIGRVVIITFMVILAGFVGYNLGGWELGFMLGFLGLVFGFVITTKSWVEASKRHREERRRNQELRRMAYHQELGRQDAIADSAYQQERSRQTRKQLQSAVRNAQRDMWGM
jgi:ABC-type transport system involved in cytochrome bd biosynthesis fused ATPase/permease subunit